MKQINLHEILIKHIPTELYDPSLDKYYLSAMKEACEKMADLCADNFEIDNRLEENNEYKSWITEESIIKTKTQIV
jgi:hypothetical protein